MDPSGKASFILALGTSIGRTAIMPGMGTAVGGAVGEIMDGAVIGAAMGGVVGGGLASHAQGHGFLEGAQSGAVAGAIGGAVSGGVGSAIVTGMGSTFASAFTGNDCWFYWSPCRHYRSSWYYGESPSFVYRGFSFCCFGGYRRSNFGHLSEVAASGTSGYSNAAISATDFLSQGVKSV